MAKPRTLYDKIWHDHLVDEQPDGTCLIYIDRHLVHEVTSPQAFEGLRLSGRKVRAPDKTLLVVDHNVPTTDRRQKNPDPESEAQIAYLAENAKFFDLEYYDEFDKRQGIVHIIGPEQGFTLPGVTLVCGDSHTATHGAFGALAYGIGTSEVEHVLATQTLIQIEIEEHARRGRRQAAGRRHRQGHHPRHHRRDRHRRRHRLRHRICRRGDPRAVHGRPHDGLQHVGRGRRQGRLHRARREGLRVREGPPEVAEGQGLGRGDALLGDAALRRRRAFRSRDQARRRKTAAAGDLGHQPRAGHFDRRPRAAPRRHRRRAQAAGRRALARIHGRSRAARRSPTSRSTASSSARAPTAASRICAPPPRWSTARPSTPRSRR